MTAQKSPAVGGSMQSRMGAELASMTLKSLGLKSNVPSPRRPVLSTLAPRTAGRSHSTRALLIPDSAKSVGIPNDAAATFAQQRAKLKAASNAAHRIFAPTLASSAGVRGTWADVSSLCQVAGAMTRLRWM